MSKKITQDELESYLWGSAVLLRNHIDAGAYKQYIFPLLFFKRLNDVYEEETEKAVKENGPEADSWEETHSFSIPDGAHWDDVRNVTENVGKAIRKAFRAIEKANSEKLQGIFGDGTWTNKTRLPDRLLKDLLEHFSSKTLSIENCPEDELGQGYEYLIKKFADDSGHTAQEFYTNRTVVHLMTEILKPESGESIYDPTCGSAGMLISSISYLKNNKKEWRNVSLYGQEINALTSAIARMNLFLHGIEDFKIVNGDTLAAPAFIERGKLQQFDVVVANPPYSTKWSADPKFMEDERYSPYGKLAPASKADFAFVQHMIHHMDEGDSRIAVLLPHGVLFRGAAEETIRKYIIKDLNYLDAVIGLPANCFQGTSIPVCCLVFKKERNGNADNIFFIDASKEFVPGKAMNYITDEHIDKIVKAYTQREDIDKYCHKAYKDEVEKNDYNLNIPRYVDTFEEEEPVDIDANKKKLAELEAKEKAALEKVNAFLSELGL